MTEDQLEQEALGWLAEVGYTPLYGPDIAPDGQAPERADYRHVILRARLSEAIHRLNPNIPALAKEDALKRVLDLGIPALLSANREFHKLLISGVPVQYQKDGRDELRPRAPDLLGKKGGGDKDVFSSRAALRWRSVAGRSSPSTPCPRFSPFYAAAHARKRHHGRVMTSPARFIPSSLQPTEEQKEIQTASGRIIVIEANAGAAKTTTLCLRIGESLARGIPPHDIIALVFTKEARDVMRRRLVEVGIAPKLAAEVRVETFDAFAASILREFEGIDTPLIDSASKLRPYVPVPYRLPSI